MKEYIVISLIFGIIFLTGCEGVDVSKLSDKDLERISEKAVVCPENYMRFGTTCCLDKDHNKICDKDERELTIAESSEETNLSTETAISEEAKNNESEIRIFGPAVVQSNNFDIIDDSAGYDQVEVIYENDVFTQNQSKFALIKLKNNSVTQLADFLKSKNNKAVVVNIIDSDIGRSLGNQGLKVFITWKQDNESVTYASQGKEIPDPTYVSEGIEVQHTCTLDEQKVACKTEYNPVCGNDEMTYGNGCIACAAGIESWTNGACLLNTSSISGSGGSGGNGERI